MRLWRPHAAPYPTHSAQKAKAGTASISDFNDPVCSRSVDRMELARQLCPILEQCREFEVLCATLASGNHDRLGVRRTGEFLVGRPWRSDVVPDRLTGRCLDGRSAEERLVVRCSPRLLSLPRSRTSRRR